MDIKQPMELYKGLTGNRRANQKGKKIAGNTHGLSALTIPTMKDTKTVYMNPALPVASEEHSYMLDKSLENAQLA